MGKDRLAMQLRKISFQLLPCLLVIALVGCRGGVSGAKPVKSDGSVTLDGAPVDGAIVTFEPNDISNGRPATGRTDSKGNFALTTYNTGDGALPGSYIVLVTKPETSTGSGPQSGNPDEVKKFLQKGGYLEMVKKAEKGEKAAKTKATGIPKAYTSKTTTPLKQTIPASGRIKIDLSSSAQ
jgi:hypothetical protein